MSSDSARKAIAILNCGVLLAIILVCTSRHIPEKPPESAHALRRPIPSQESVEKEEKSRTDSIAARIRVEVFGPSSIEAMAVSPDGVYMATAGYDGNWRLWSIETGKLLRTFEGHYDEVRDITFSRDGRYVLTGSYDKHAVLWELATGRAISSIEVHVLDRIEAVAISPDNRFALAGGRLGLVCVWDLEMGRVVHLLDSPIRTLSSLAVSADGSTILAGYEGGLVKLFDRVTGKEIKEEVVYGGSRNRGEHECYSRETDTQAAFSPDGKTILIGMDCHPPRLLDAKSGVHIRTLAKGNESDNASRAAAFSPDGRFVLTGGKQTRLWHVETGKVVRDFGYGSELVAFVGGCYDVLAASESTLRVFSVEEEMVREFAACTHSIGTVQFSPDDCSALTCTESDHCTW